MTATTQLMHCRVWLNKLLSVGGVSGWDFGLLCCSRKEEDRQTFIGPPKRRVVQKEGEESMPLLLRHNQLFKDLSHEVPSRSVFWFLSKSFDYHLLLVPPPLPGGLVGCLSL